MVNKRILVVDDEPDVLETVVEILEKSFVETARTYDEAKDLLSSQGYDLAILDIMGVRGLDLLDDAVKRGIPAVMLTAPGFNPHYVLESMERGALSCFPKEDLAQLDVLLKEIFRIVSQDLNPVAFTIKRLEPLLDARFSPDWKTRLDKLLKSHPILKEDDKGKPK
ncbi:MAG: response regulator [Desulfomonile sp.]|nr:response regulator [Desulfomonile sp.]